MKFRVVYRSQKGWYALEMKKFILWHFVEWYNDKDLALHGLVQCIDKERTDRENRKAKDVVICEEKV